MPPSEWRRELAMPSECGRAHRAARVVAAARLRASTSRRHSAQPRVSEVLGYINASPKLGPTLCLTRANAIIGAAARGGRVAWARMRPSASPTLCATVCTLSFGVHNRVPESVANFAWRFCECRRRGCGAGRGCRRGADALKRLAHILRNRMYLELWGT